MIKNKTILFVSCVLILSGCSITDRFSKKSEGTTLEGERLSVLELQRSLNPDTPLKSGQQFVFPDVWENTSWPQAGGYPNHSMQNLALDTSSLKKVWSESIGKGSRKNLPLTAQPIIAKGMVFTLDTNQTLSATDATLGKRVWKTKLENKDEDENVISGGVAFAHDTVFVTTGYDEVVAISPTDGNVKWRKRLPAPSRAAPTILSGRVYVSTIDSRLVALDAKDGTSLWEYVGINETTGLLGAASPAANNEIVVPAFSSGELTALRIENGSVAWSDNLASVRNYGGGLESLADIKGMPVIHQGIIVAISFGGKLVAIDERTGTRIWQREISGAQTPWVTGNTLFVISTDNQLIALNLLNGSIFWVEQLKQFESSKKKTDPINWSGPVMANGRLIVTSSHGHIVEVNAHNGSIIHTTKSKKDIQIAPIVALNTLYILAEDGTLIAYR